MIDAANEAYLTVEEIAVTLRVSKMTIYRLVDAGVLPAVRIGRSLRIPVAAFREYLQAQSRTPQ